MLCLLCNRDRSQRGSWEILTSLRSRHSCYYHHQHFVTKEAEGICQWMADLGAEPVLTDAGGRACEALSILSWRRPLFRWTDPISTWKYSAGVSVWGPGHAWGLNKSVYVWYMQCICSACCISSPCKCGHCDYLHSGEYWTHGEMQWDLGNGI